MRHLESAHGPLWIISRRWSALAWPGWIRRSWAVPVPALASPGSLASLACTGACTCLTRVLSFTGLYRYLHLPHQGPQLHWPALA